MGLHRLKLSTVCDRDVVKFYVIRVIFQPQEIGNTYHIHTEYLNKVIHGTIFQLFGKAMHISWPNNVNHKDVLLIVSNATPYKKKQAVIFKHCIQKLCM